MATYCGQNYGAGKPGRIWKGIKSSSGMMMVYAMATFILLRFGATWLALLFVDSSETEIIRNTELFLQVSSYFFPALGLLCILRYTIQGAGYTNLAMMAKVGNWTVDGLRPCRWRPMATTMLSLDPMNWPERMS